MKKLAYYAGIMIAIIIILPMLIVKACWHQPESKPSEKPPIVGEMKIGVYDPGSGKTTVMDLEEYIKGVVAAEMPASFDLEALKAQAVAARTFAYGRMTGAYRPKAGIHDDAAICTDSTHCQAWVSGENAMKKWNIFFAAGNWRKIVRAVDLTKGMIVTYKGSIANTLFHASSAGRTENCEDVWAGIAVPYLRSVESIGEEESKDYVTSISIDKQEFLKKLQLQYPDHKFNKNIFKNIKILDHTEGGRVKTLKVGDITLKGTEFRTIFKLRSAAFTVSEDKKGNILVKTTGYGHGVGMSQWGADSLAKKGATYIEILKHYYTGVEIVSIPEFSKTGRLQ